MGIASAVANVFDLIFVLLIISVLLTWFRNIDWYKQPFRFLRTFSELVFAPFRKLIPPMGGLDFSPIVAFIVLEILRTVTVSFLVSMGL